MVTAFLFGVLPCRGETTLVDRPDSEAVPTVEGLFAKDVASIAAAIVAASIAAYRQSGPGPCACPDDTDRAN
jgi:hypothetical protein